MKQKKLTVILSLVLALCMLAACGQQTPAPAPAQTPAPTEAPAPTQAPAPAATEAPTPEPTPEPAPEPAQEQITVTDMMGREITLSEPAERIVALTASDCEILYAIGAGDALVGRGEYCDYPAEVFDVPSVQSGYETNIEQIIALQPQVLLMSTMAQTEEQVAQLEAAGVRVVVSDAQDIDGIYTAIRMIGTLMGRVDNAEKIVKEMQDGFAELASRAGENSGKSVYFEVSPLEWGLYTAGKGTFMNEVAELIGLKNCFDDMDGWASISEEQVLQRDPDYIVTITMYFGEGPTPEEEIAGRAGWEQVKAVQNGAILNLPNNELSRPVPRLLDGARMLFDFVHDNAAEKAA